MGDFGVVSKISEGADEMDGTRSLGTRSLGTRSWRAPETRRNEYGHQVDVFGFGLVAIFASKSGEIPKDVSCISGKLIWLE